MVSGSHCVLRVRIMSKPQLVVHGMAAFGWVLESNLLCVTAWAQEKVRKVTYMYSTESGDAVNFRGKKKKPGSDRTNS